MISEWIDIAKIKIGKKYLDWCEELPRFNGGFIGYLQSIREWERKDSSEAFNTLRLPPDLDLQLSGIQLFEVFHVENISDLENGIKNLFPTQDRINGVLKLIEKGKGKLTGGFWSHVGCLVKRQGLLSRPYRIMEQLPPYVKLIEMELFRFLPSFYVISFDVQFEQSVTHDFQAIFDRHYLPKSVFKTVLPWRVQRAGYYKTPLELVIESKVTSFINDIRASTEECILPYFQGYFYRSFKQQQLRLPCVELFSLTAKQNNVLSLARDQKYRRWFYVIGFGSPASTY